MTKSKMNMRRVAHHVVIPQFVPAVVEISVAKMAGLIAMMKTRFGTMKMILKCVLNVQERVLRDGVLNAVVICREHPEQSQQWMVGKRKRIMSDSNPRRLCDCFR